MRIDLVWVTYYVHAYYIFHIILYDNAINESQCLAVLAVNGWLCRHIDTHCIFLFFSILHWSASIGYISIASHAMCLCRCVVPNAHAPCSTMHTVQKPKYNDNDNKYNVINIVASVPIALPLLSSFEPICSIHFQWKCIVFILMSFSVKRSIDKEHWANIV